MGILVIGVFAAGWVAGLLGRKLLARLRRGVVLPAPACELPIAVLWAACTVWTVARAGPLWWLPVPLTLAWFGVLLAVVDLAARRLPDVLTATTFAAVALCLGTAAFLGPHGELGWHAAVGALVFWLAHLAVHLIAPGALGAGDVKLAGSLGGVLGAVGLPMLAVAAVLAATVTAALAATARVIAYRHWRDGVPHGPGLLLATWLLAALPGGSAALAA